LCSLGIDSACKTHNIYTAAAAVVTVTITIIITSIYTTVLFGSPRAHGFHLFTVSVAFGVGVGFG
jgi:hypothetical protein